MCLYPTSLRHPRSFGGYRKPTVTVRGREQTSKETIPSLLTRSFHTLVQFLPVLPGQEKKKHSHLDTALRHKVWFWVVLCGAQSWTQWLLRAPSDSGYSVILLIILEKCSVCEHTTKSDPPLGKLTPSHFAPVFFQTECSKPFSKLCTFSSCWFLFPTAPSLRA